jgi:hypothetical protein
MLFQSNNDYCTVTHLSVSKLTLGVPVIPVTMVTIRVSQICCHVICIVHHVTLTVNFSVVTLGQRVVLVSFYNLTLVVYNSSNRSQSIEHILEPNF